MNKPDGVVPFTPWIVGQTKHRLPFKSKPQTNVLALQDHELTTEYGNAQRFVHQHGDRVKFCHSEKRWFIWTGRMWQADIQNQVESLAMNTARKIFDEAATIQDLKKKTDLIKWSQLSMSHAKITKMLKIASSILPVTQEQFDSDRWIINASNGMVDLRTGNLLSHNKDKLITKICNATYQKEAECPTWDRFLDRIFAGNTELIRYLQKMVGYCLTGSVSEKCFFILHGEKGDNGKTVFINTIMELLGDYSMQTPIDTLLKRKPGSQSNDLVRMNKSRFVSSAEANKQTYFDEALVKRLTGDDPITARELYKEYVTFKPECKIVIATNRIPRFDRTDTAFSNRVKIIPFNVSIPLEEQDKNLKEKLMLESEGILAWAVRGCLLWQEQGLGDIPLVDAVNVEIRSDNSVENFVTACCVQGNDHYIKVADLYEAYTVYHANIHDGVEPVAISKFGVKLSEMGFLMSHTRDGNYRSGIGLKADTITDKTNSSDTAILNVD